MMHLEAAQSAVSCKIYWYICVTETDVMANTSNQSGKLQGTVQGFLKFCS
jgi:hypothetical protein